MRQLLKCHCQTQEQKRNCHRTISVQVSHCQVQLFATHGLQQARLLCPSPTPGACSNSCPLSWWCHPTISSSIIPFSCLLSFPASGSFPMSRLFTSGGQSINLNSFNFYELQNGWGDNSCLTGFLVMLSKEGVNWLSINVHLIVNSKNVDKWNLKQPPDYILKVF